jgi:hypothetical protein
MDNEKMKDLVVELSAKIIELEKVIEMKEISSSFWFKKFHDLEKETQDAPEEQEVAE